MTEIDADQAAPLSTQKSAVETEEVTQNSGFGDGANAAAEANWDQNNDLSASQEWVEVPRDAAETETGVVATPAAPANTQSWADDQPDSPKQVCAGQSPSQRYLLTQMQQKSTQPANNNDGFHEVQRNRGQNRNQQGGPHRGRGGRGGDGRGRGGFRGRGDGRGRGRGGQDRGGRRPEADAQ